MLYVFEKYLKYDKLISDIKTSNKKIKPNDRYHFGFYIEMMKEAKINVTKCYDSELFYKYKDITNLSKYLDTVVDNIYFNYKGLYGFFISFNLKIGHRTEIFTYKASEIDMELFLYNTINNGSIIC